MKMKVFSLYDSAAQAFTKPVFAQNQGLVLRSVVDELSNPHSELYKHAMDYTLYEIAEWDDVKGEIKPHPVNVKIGNLNEFIPKNNYSASQSDKPSKINIPDQEGRTTEITNARQ